VDGVNRWQRIMRITLPSIKPLIIMMVTLRVGTMFVQGFDMILLLYMPSTYDTADVISTYTYRMAFGSQINYGMASASGLFQSVIGTSLLFISNWLNRKVNETSLF
jgi:ABC-type polysaccharide transport system permease subunit